MSKKSKTLLVQRQRASFRDILSIVEILCIESMDEKEASNLKLDPNDGMNEPLGVEEEKTGIDSITKCTF